MSRADTRTNPAPQARSPAELKLAFDDNRFASLVFGQYDQNIAKIEHRLGVVANASGNHVILKGTPEACGQARRVLESLYERVRQGQAITLGDVDGAIAEIALQGSLFPRESDGPRVNFDQITTRKRGAVRARNVAQDLYLKLLKSRELVFAEGPAGTGKLPARRHARESRSLSAAGLRRAL